MLHVLAISQDLTSGWSRFLSPVFVRSVSPSSLELNFGQLGGMFVQQQCHSIRIVYSYNVYSFFLLPSIPDCSLLHGNARGLAEVGDKARIQVLVPVAQAVSNRATTMQACDGGGGTYCFLFSGSSRLARAAAKPWKLGENHVRCRCTNGEAGDAGN